jgi:hypothetical protein
MVSLPGKTHTQNYGMRTRGSGKGYRYKQRKAKRRQRGKAWRDVARNNKTREDKKTREEKYSTQLRYASFYGQLHLRRFRSDKSSSDHQLLYYYSVDFRFWILSKLPVASQFILSPSKGPRPRNFVERACFSLAATLVDVGRTSSSRRGSSSAKAGVPKYQHAPRVTW